jgi:hypothetical protein
MDGIICRPCRAYNRTRSGQPTAWVEAWAAAGGESCDRGRGAENHIEGACTIAGGQRTHTNKQPNPKAPPHFPPKKTGKKWPPSPSSRTRCSARPTASECSGSTPRWNHCARTRAPRERGMYTMSHHTSQSRLGSAGWPACASFITAGNTSCSADGYHAAHHLQHLRPAAQARAPKVLSTQPFPTMGVQRGNSAPCTKKTDSRYTSGLAARAGRFALQGPDAIETAHHSSTVSAYVGGHNNGRSPNHWSSTSCN